MTARDRLDAIEARLSADETRAARWHVPGGMFVQADTISAYDALLADMPALVAALRAVLDLHAPAESGICEECSDEWVVFHPCPTVAAIDTHLGGAS